MKTKLTKEQSATMSPKEIFEFRLLEGRHEDQLPECRRLYLAMLAENSKKAGRWARFVAWVKDIWRVKRQDDSGKVEDQKAERFPSIVGSIGDGTKEGTINFSGYGGSTFRIIKKEQSHDKKENPND